MDLEIVRADLSEVEVAASILREAERWLESRDKPLWPLDMLTAEALEPTARDGDLYLAKQGGRAVATCVLQWEDAVFWPEIPRGESAFLHRLAVRRCVGGKGVAPAILVWAAERARDAGCTTLRLDCSASHPGLWAYYEAAGFRRNGERRLGFYRAVRFEQRL